LHDTYLPVWISFPFWTAKIEESPNVLSILDIVQAWLHLWSEDRLWPLFEAALNDERLLLMVDGLDEYRSEDSARNALAQLQVFAEQRNCRVLATARPAGYDRLSVQRTSWPATYLAELTLAQQKEYAIRWYSQQRDPSGNDSEQAEIDRSIESTAAGFMAEMRSSADLSELAKTPLLLGLLLYLKSSSIPLPNSRYRAFGRLVEHLISVHPIARRRAAMVRAQDNDLSPEDARIVFANLAFHLQSELPEGLIDRRVAEDAISRFLREDVLGFGLAQSEARRQARALLTLGEQALGLLVERGPQELGFLHRSFQEYLAAEHIARKPFADQSNFVKDHCTEPVGKRCCSR
jgi:predicted NACHT family NTPase